MSVDLCFESYGAVIAFSADDVELAGLARHIANEALVGHINYIEESSTPDCRFSLHRESGGLYFTYDGERSGVFKEITDLSRTLNSVIRVKVAWNASPWLFIHAGVVGWRGKAIVMPAASRQGKTSLVAELVKAGAEYYSDEYAVLDEQGSVHPFERDLSVRFPDPVVPSKVPVTALGGIAGTKPLEIGLVILTQYERGAEWFPENISMGNGILLTLPQTIPLKNKAESSLKCLNTAFRSAIILKGSRGEASAAANLILSFFDRNLNLREFPR